MWLPSPLPQNWGRGRGGGLQPVQRLRIVLQDLACNRGRYLRVLLEGAQRFELGRGVRVAVVRPDNQVVLAGEPQQVGQIVVRLAGDVHAVVAERVFAQRRLLLPFATAAGVGNDPGQPRRAGLDETEAERGELAGDVVVQEG